MCCSRQQPKREASASATEISLSPIADQNHASPSHHASPPDLIYAAIQPAAKVNDDVTPREDPEDSGAVLYCNVRSKDDAADSGDILYDELQRKDGTVHAVAPSGDLYAQVKK